MKFEISSYAFPGVYYNPVTWSSKDEFDDQVVSVILYITNNGNIALIHVYEVYKLDLKTESRPLEIHNVSVQGSKKSYNREMIWSLKCPFLKNMLWNKFL